MQRSKFHELFYLFTFFGTVFGAQFSPVDPFENELYEKTIKSFSSKMQ